MAWLRHLVAWSVGSALMLGGVLLVGDPDRTRVLLYYPAIWGVVLVIDAVVSGFDVAEALRRPPRDRDSEPGDRPAVTTGSR